jgi:NADH-quinone oxidoreductase subunit H
MKWLGGGLPGVAPVLLALTFAYLLFGTGSCTQEAGPELVKVLDVTPREVEVGDHVTMVGEGFPAGRKAHVFFRGTLHRPGDRPVRDAEIPATGTVVGPDQVELAFDEATEARFCGAGDRAAHTTFEGDVVVAFAAAATGAPPITGSLRHVVFDVRPSAGPADVERDHEGQRVLSFLGIHATQGASGLFVESVDPGSRAEAAQIQGGDVLASFDGVRVATPADVIPPIGEREAAVGVKHAGSLGESPRNVAVEGFQRTPSTDLLDATLIVLVALLVVALFAAPTPPALAVALERVVFRIRVHGRVPRQRLGAAFAAVARACLPPPGVPALVDALVCSVFAALPFGQYLVASQLDVGLLFVTGATALAASALLTSETFWGGVKAGASVVWQHVPAAAAIVSVVLTTGSLRLQEIERAQGGCPWDWLAFRHPAALAALVILLASGNMAVGERESGLASLVEDERPTPAVTRGPWLETALRAHRLILAGLASTLFLGGWLLPGVPPATQDARPWLELAGAALLLTKTFAVVLALGAIRAFGPQAAPGGRNHAMLSGRLPLAMGAIAATVAWSWWGLGRAVQNLVSEGLLIATALAAAAFAHRMKRGVEAPEARMSPFL